MVLAHWPCVILLLAGVCSTCRGKELSLGMRIHLNPFIIPTGWRAGGRGGPPCGEDPGIPANQKSLITFNSPRESLSRLSYLLWERKAALAILT